MRSAHLTHPILCLPLVFALSACGGGGSAAPEAAALAVQPPSESVVLARSQTGTVTEAQREAAASATAQSTANACHAIRPFYWEMGNGSERLVGGSVASPTTTLAYDATTPISIASASKWLYGAYVAQKANGQLSELDTKFLTLRSGYVNLQDCDSTQTIDSCLAAGDNGAYLAQADDKFYYGGGHLQKHASLAGLGSMDNHALAAEVRSQLGADVALTYIRPQPPGGVAISPDGYARVLRKMMRGELRIGALLGSAKVCTNGSTCGHDQALSSPVPSTESWHYSIGHWVEDDPLVGDGAFSSAGAFGFYPWIDAAKSSYGVIARVARVGSGYASAQCGRLLRKAWTSGLAQ